MPINRHLTWGDRQAEAAREKGLRKLQKLAASVPVPAAPTTPEVTKAPQPARTTPAKTEPTPPAKSATKKSAPVKVKKTTKK